MSFTADANDHLILKRREALRTRLANFVVAYAASLTINAALLLLMFVEIEVWVEIPVVEETPIDIVVEPPPIDAAEIMQENPPPPAAEQRPSAPASTPNVADEERQLKAPPAQETIAGDGTGDNASGSTPRPEAARDRYSRGNRPGPAQGNFSPDRARRAKTRFRGNNREPRRRARRESPWRKKSRASRRRKPNRP